MKAQQMIVYVLSAAGALALPLGSAQANCADGAEPAYWVAPMDPDFRRDAPGKSPMGMDLVPYCESSASGQADVQIDPAVVQNLGVRTVKVAAQALAPRIEAVGQVVWDESRLQRIHPRAAGWIEQLGPKASGEEFSSGDLLYALYAPELHAAEAEYLASLGNRSLQQAAGQRLRALGYVEAQISALKRRGKPAGLHAVQATRDARVIALNVREGQYVSPGSELMRVGDPSRLWLIAQLTERDAAAVFMGQQASVTWPVLGDESVLARVTHIHPELDQRTRTQRVRLELDDPQPTIRPGMFAHVVLHGPVGPKRPVVPEQAVIRSPDGDRVLRALGGGAFDVVAVTRGHTAAGQTQILQGLEPGDEIVVAGQFLLDSEANISAETLRFRARPASERMTEGRVVGFDRERRFITLDHAYIEAIDMPAMVMSFDVAAGVDMQALQIDQRVLFMADKPEAADYRIIHLEIQP